jgi:hypothetical protein
MAHVVIQHVYSPLPLLMVWIVVIILVAAIGALTQNPPERPNQSFNENNQKVQYITIGGASSSKTTNN